MQATTSHVTPSSFEAESLFNASSYDDEIGSYVLPALKKAASAAGRDHLLVRRRRRGSRRSAR